jgi:hypothetical protein
LYEQYKTKEGVEVEDYWVNGQLLSDVEKNNNSRLPVAGETAKTNYTNEDNPKETFVELLTSI